MNVVRRVVTTSNILLGLLVMAGAAVASASATTINEITLFEPAGPAKVLSNHEPKKFDLFGDEEFKKILPIPLSKYYQPPDRSLQTINSPVLHENKIANDLMDSRIFYFRMPVSAPLIYFSNFDETPQFPAFTPYHVASAAPAAYPIHPLHLPIPFTSNGKPSHIYKFPQNEFVSTSRPTSKPKITSTAKPTVNLNKGPYHFNGKPADIYLLQDSFNTFFENSLNGLYP